MTDITQLGDQMALLQTLNDLGQAMDTYSRDPSMDCMNGVCEVMAGLAHPMRTIEFADDNDLQLELLRTLEIHGDGLRPYPGTGFQFQVRDILIAPNRALWMVLAVDKDGKVVQITGSSPTTNTTPNTMQLMWRPTSQARAWLRPGETAAPAYSDLNQAMAYLVRLWGDQQSGSGRDLTTPTGFFLELMHAPGLKIDSGALDESAAAADVLAFCKLKGAGLRPFTSATKIVPGDLILMKSKTWALVTRTGGDGSPVDLLVGGSSGAGDLGIGDKAVKLVRGVNVAGLDQVWRPAA